MTLTILVEGLVDAGVSLITEQIRPAQPPAGETWQDNVPWGLRVVNYSYLKRSSDCEQKFFTELTETVRLCPHHAH